MSVGRHRQKRLSPFSDCCPRGQEAVEGAHDALDVRGGEEAPAEVRGVVVQSQVHRGHHRCLLEVEGQPDQGHDRTVAKVAARSEGALVDEVEALDLLPAVTALNLSAPKSQGFLRFAIAMPIADPRNRAISETRESNAALRFAISGCDF